MNEMEIRKLLEQEPLLTNHGIGAFDEYQMYTIDSTNESFIMHRSELLNKGKQIEACVKWLRKFEYTTEINRSIGSSEILKTYIEKEYKMYITNGAFITALIYLKIPYDAYLNYPFVDVGLKTIDESMNILK